MNVLVVGDVILDRRIEGETDRLSPEAPVPVVKSRRIHEQPGGAANVAANLSWMGAYVRLCGVIGTDANGKRLDHLLRTSYNVTTCLPSTTETSITTTKTRVTSGGHPIVRIDEEGDKPLANTAEIRTGLEVLLSSHTTPDAIVIADYAKGAMTVEICSWLLARAAELDIPVFVDAKPSEIASYAGVRCLKINLKEAVEWCNAHGVVHPGLAGGMTNIDAGMCAAKELSSRLRVTTVIVTCGALGAVYHDETGVAPVTAYIPAEAREVFDVTGAGDTFMAAFVTELTGTDVASAIKHAHVAAGLAVAHYGTHVVRQDDVHEEIYRQEGPASKIMDDDALGQFLARRIRGKHRDGAIVLANGCFDMLHAGHLRLLKWARSRGQTVVVALNSDESVASLKGEGRPCIAGSSRATMLADLDYVHAVHIFDGDVEALVRRVNPDILVKGSEYLESVVPGAAYVTRKGGELLFSPMLERVSTTEIVAEERATSVDAE